ncbi:hypothetical protein HY745_00305 [Candidatus Desantisbacteria bacterium]|nr:hypothetical protein [Candidatus Desantisbacteria bacterium]
MTLFKVYKNPCLIKIDPEYTVPRLAFTFLSFSLIYEVIEKAIKSYTSSKIMLETDNELTRVGKDNIKEEHLLKIFNQYCDIKETAPNVPSFVYKSNKDRLNSGWNCRDAKSPNPHTTWHAALAPGGSLQSLWIMPCNPHFSYTY